VAYFAFPSWDVWPAAMAGLAMLYMALEPLRSGLAYLATFGFGAAMFLPLFRWADVAAGHAPWVILALASAAILAVFGFAWSNIRRIGFIARHRVVAPIAFATAWAAIEELRQAWPFGGFPWGRVAFSQAGAPTANIAWLGGVPLLSWAVALAGALVATVVIGAAKGRTWLGCAAALGAFGIVLAPTLAPLDSRPQDGTLAIGAVQGNVPPEESAVRKVRERHVLANHLAGTLALLNRVESGALDLVVWPEDSTDLDPAAHDDVANLVTRAAAAVGAPILLGSIEYPESGGRYNVGLLWDPARGAIDRYAKQRPAPFAEYIPLRSLARLVTDKVDGVSVDMLPGSEVAVIDVPIERDNRIIPIGDIICFEVAYDSIVADSVRAGAELLVVQTNNSSFGQSAEPTQQLAMSRLRAIEFGRATIQISTTGVSAMISPTGVILSSTGTWTPAQLVATLPLRTSLSPAARFGREVGWCLLALGTGLALVGIASTATRRKKGLVN
jgi:apolipoprotein N-acyltransferase